MNLNEERNYQKLLEVLDTLELNETNRKLAEQYMDINQPENKELLKNTVRQDFSDLNDTKESIAYLDHLYKRKRIEELGRYARFMAAVGGSTAHYVLVGNSWYLRDFLAQQLREEEILAIRMEGVVWSRHMLNSRSLQVFFDTGKKKPDTLLGARELCYHKYDNAQVLLSAIYLRSIQPVLARKRFGLFAKAPEGAGKQEKIVKFLEDNLVSSIPALFANKPPVSKGLEVMQDFVRAAREDAVFPSQITELLRGTQFSDYLLSLLAGAAFLALEHSGVFLTFLRLAAAMNLDTTMDACLHISDGTWFKKHVARLEAIADDFEEPYVLWCVRTGCRGANGVDDTLARMISRKPQVVKNAAARISTEEFQYLMEQVKLANRGLYQEMEASFGEKYDDKLAAEMVNDIRPGNGQAEAKRYLLGEAGIEALYPFAYSWRGGYTYNYQRFQRLNRMNRNSRMFRRGLVIEGLRMQGGFFTGYFLTACRDGRSPVRTEEHEKKYAEEIKRLIGIFTQENMSVQYQADALEGICENYYNLSDKTRLLDAAVKALTPLYRDHAPEFYDSIKNSTSIGRGISLRVLDNFHEQEKETLLKAAMDSSRQVREVLAAILSAHKEWEPEIKDMLKSRKSQERDMAVRVMKAWGVSRYRAELTEALGVEKSKKLKEFLMDCLGIQNDGESEGTSGNRKTLDELAAEVLKGGKKRKVAWACETPLGTVHKLDGTEASGDYLQAILVAYADKSVPGVSPEAARLAAELDQQELALYVGMLFDRWMKAGAEAKKKWVLYAAAIHGGDAIISDLYHQIQEWPQNARGAMAAEAVKALALNGSSRALLLVDQISRKFKFRQVKTAAADALTYAAEQLGITRAELEDRIVPNLGFDEELKQVFDYGTRSFTVYLTPALELEIFDKDGKKVKNLPAPGKRDQEEKAKAENDRFKQMKKQLKTVVGNQKLRLEQALGTGRQWRVEQWKELFVKNPVMHQFAMGLIWGLYEEAAHGADSTRAEYRLKDTFRYMEDGSFNTVDEEEYDFPETGMIGLVHPIELEAELLAEWKEQLSDYEITQPIQQLERPVYLLTEEEKKQKELIRFGGKVLNGLSLSGKLQSQGWYRGSVQDGGVYCTFYREDGSIGTELSFSGSYVGDENEEVTVYEAVFYRAGTVKRGSYVYDTVKDANQYALADVSPRYFSEIVLQLTKATASSQEQVAYPDCKR